MFRSFSLTCTNSIILVPFFFQGCIKFPKHAGFLTIHISSFSYHALPPSPSPSVFPSPEVSSPCLQVLLPSKHSEFRTDNLVIFFARCRSHFSAAAVSAVAKVGVRNVNVYQHVVNAVQINSASLLAFLLFCTSCWSIC